MAQCRTSIDQCPQFLEFVDAIGTEESRHLMKKKCQVEYKSSHGHKEKLSNHSEASEAHVVFEWVSR